jgi:DNA-binding NtrC family response regulator
MNQDTCLKSVLVIDDEPLVLKYTCSVIAGLGYKNVHKASCALDARALLLTQSFAMIVCDVSLPDGDGRQLLREAMEANPDAAGILITGFACDELKVSADLQERIRLLEKPFTADDISEVLAKTFEQTSIETTCAH